MMKQFKYIIALTALTVGLSVLAQEPAEKPVNIYTHKDTTEAVCYPSSKPYTEWRGKSLPRVTGIYHDTMQAKAGGPDTVYYDIYSLRLQVKEFVYKTPRSVSVCKNDLPYEWRSKLYKTDGTYYDTVKVRESLAKDTIYTLNLTVLASYEKRVDLSFCPGDKVEYRGRVYNTEKIDTIRVTASSGCDSLFIVHAHLKASSMQTLEQEICKGDAYVWHRKDNDTIITRGGYYYEKNKNMEGCDSVICLHLTVNEVVVFEDSVALCEQYLPYKFGNKKLYDSGVYHDTIIRSGGKCDSIVCLKFTALKDEYVNKTIKFCSTVGATHNGGTRFYNDSMFIDTLLSAQGCRRFVKTIYLAGYPYISEEFKHRTKDSVNYVWRGKVYTKDGTYSYTTKGEIACDTTWILHLMTDYTVDKDSTFCQGDTLYYKNFKIFETCTILDSLLTKFGGDSVIRIHFKAKERFIDARPYTICNNKPRPWPGHDSIMFYGEGTYYDYRPTSNEDECDSMYIAYVSEGQPVIKDTAILYSRWRDRDSLPYVWIDRNGEKHFYNYTIDIYDTLGVTSDEYGCDSVNIIHLQIAEYWSFDTLKLCPNGEVVVNNVHYTEVGDYEQWFTRGPESTFTDSTLFIHIDSADIHYNIVWDSDTICQSETPYVWHNRKCMTTGEYQDTIPALLPPHCDSIVYLRLKVNPTYLVPINYNICAGEVAKYKGKEFPKGVYYDTLVCKVTGCDSIIQLNVNEVPTYYWCDTVYFKKGSSYTWYNHYGKDTVLTQAGIYHDSCRTHLYGCDSIYCLVLNEKPSQIYEETATICANEKPYKWRNKFTFIESGVYYDSLFNKLGGDSVYQLTLTIYPTYEDSTVDIFECYGKTVRIGTKEFTEAGTYRDTLKTVVGGCDSVITYHINFLKTTVFNEIGHLGPSYSYYWAATGETLTQPGFYTNITPSLRLECDSIIHHLTLIRDSAYAFDTTATICSNERFRWQGYTFTAKDSGDHVMTYHTSQGMDSIYTLHLKVNMTQERVVYNNLCQGQSIFVHGQNINKSFTYSDTLMTKSGCDSIIKTVVNFYPTYYQCDTIRMIAGTSVTWHDRVYTKPGIDSIHMTTSICGCDSDLYVIILQTDTFSYVETETICQGDTIYWRGQKLYKEGTYKDPYISHLGADSCYYMNLRVAPTFTDTSYASLCPGGKLTFFHQAITEPGTYSETLISTKGCDSTYVLIVNPTEAEITYITEHICQGDSLRFRDVVFTTSGEYEYVDKSLTTGCDSVVHLTVQVGQTYLKDTTATINQGSTFIWKGHKQDIQLTKAGIYMDSLLTVNGCDSVYRLHLRVNPSYYFEEEVSICKTELPYEWRGYQLNEGGTHYDSLFTQSVGLDSVYCLKLEVRDASLQDETIYACQGEIVVMPDGTRFTNSAVYLDTLFEGGCPQVTRYNINFYRSYYDTTRAWFCEGRSYTWYKHKNDTVITKAGTYEDRHETMHGCDSIFVLYLNQISLSRIDTTIYICKEEVPYKHPGKIGDYYDNRDFADTTLATLTGCDSIIRITRYRLNDKCSSFDLYMRCPTETLYIDQRPITTDGEYRIPLPGDSIHRFRVASYPRYEFSTDLGVVCDSIRYRNKLYRAFSNYHIIHDTLPWKTVNGCDSIEYVTVVLHQTADPKTNSQEIFDYAYMLFDGQRYDQTGVYVHNHHTSFGCDSVITLDLKVIPTENPGSKVFYYCSGDKEDLVVFGKSYHPMQDTIISDTIRYEGFGMLKIQKATVYVTAPLTITSVDAPEEVCSDKQIRFHINYEHKGSYPTRYELTFLPNQLVASPNPQKGEINYRNYVEVDMNGNGLCVSPGEYPYKLRFVSEQCSLSDTTVFGTILVRYPESIMEVYWDNTVALVNQTYNVGHWDLKPPYNWQIFSANGEDKTNRINPNQNVSYISSNLLSSGDYIRVTPMRDGYDKAVPSCSLLFTYTLEEGRVPVLVYPTAVRKSAHITIESSEKGKYSLYNNTGDNLSNGAFEDSKQTIQMPGSEGCYLLYLTPQNSGTQIHKIIVY